MKRLLRSACILVLLLPFSCGDDDSSLSPLSSLDEGISGGEEINRTFAAKESVRITTVSGACLVKTGESGEILVQVVHRYDPADAFEAKFAENDDELVLEEELDESASGSSIWTVTVPAGTGIHYTSASGEFRIEGLTGGMEAATASGDITVKGGVGGAVATTASGNVEITDFSGGAVATTASGNVEITDFSGGIVVTTASGKIGGKNLTGGIVLNTASGDIDIENSTGGFQMASASGDIEADEIVIEDESEFSTASGDVDVALKRGTEHDLKLSSASGDAVLDYNGNPIEGHFVFTAQVDDGRIVSPFAFESEEEFLQGGERYHRKSFSREGSRPEITINTASGKAELRK